MPNRGSEYEIERVWDLGLGATSKADCLTLRAYAQLLINPKSNTDIYLGCSC